ncbi:hypothetical protein GQ43DRAFT_297924 [Delitschia confertaspora ATCC 74209]|uniref:Uncharacterized protein n=1 Tax=Delitschia confertaspora ATCC 74209 TaxID=1513339 RepID=A0A9P4JT76_9PLEO|nr:hypothetical protein GQ43DRAFT_297924 [Delitschia confertaspora ATCC 74209]
MSAILKYRIITSSPTHTLRAISVLTFPPAFLLLLVQGIASRRVNPAIGLIPLAFSSAFSTFLLYNEKRCGCQSSGLTGPIHLVADAILGVGLLVCLILTWVNLPRHWAGSQIMFGTYCSNFLLVNFFIHLHFSLQQLYELGLPGSISPTSCPHCQQSGSLGLPIRRGYNNGYAPLLEEEMRQEEYCDHHNDGSRDTVPAAVPKQGAEAV